MIRFPSFGILSSVRFRKMLSGLVVDWTAVIVKTSFHRKTTHDTIDLSTLYQFFFLLPVDLDDIHLISHSFESFCS